jgi:hypothetical protein
MTRPSGAVLAVGGITLLAIALRLAAFDESFFGDEMFTYVISTRPDLHAVLAGVRSDLEITPPLYFVVAWAFQKLGDPFTFLRLPSLLAGVATVPLVYLLGLQTVGRRAALVATGLFALSPLAIYYATEARAYALMTLLLVLSTIVLLRAIETNDRRWWAALALLAAGAMYTHYTAIFVLATQAGWALFAHRQLVRPLLLTHGAAALLYLPWLPFLAEDSDAPAQKAITFLDPFRTSSAVRHLARLADGGPYAPLTDLPGTLALVLLAAAAAIGLGGLVWRARRAGPRSVPSRIVLIAMLAVAAPVWAALYSAITDDLFVARNLISSLPALALAFAVLLTALPRALAVPAVVAAIAALALGAAGTLERSGQRPAYEEAAAWVEDRARPSDIVLDTPLFPPPPGLAFRVHLDSDQAVYTVNSLQDQEQQAVHAALESGGRIIYVHPDLYLFRDFDPPLVARRFQPVETHSWPGFQGLTAVVYERR